MNWEAFFRLHQGLGREGPGLPDDVAWALDFVGGTEGARILDAGCGPGADTETLVRLCPHARITAVDAHAGFTDQVRARTKNADVQVITGDMATVPGPFDLIWCAGALYFLGLETGLGTMREKLSPAGVLAFSEPCFFTDAPSPGASALWEGYRARGQGDLLSAVAEHGFEVLGARPLADAAWTAYYEPLLARATRLRDGADDDLLAAIEATEAEYAAWRRARRETGYMLVVARRS